MTADPRSVIRAVVRDLREKLPAEVIGARFHEFVAHLVLEWQFVAGNWREWTR